MIIPDINLLIYAHNDQAPDHAKSKDWWEGLLNGRDSVGLAWITISGFIRLMTHPRVLAHPLKVEQVSADTAPSITFTISDGSEEEATGVIHFHPVHITEVTFGNFPPAEVGPPAPPIYHELKSDDLVTQG